MSNRPGPEGVVEQYLRVQVLDAGGVCHKFLSTRAGVPDRIVVLNGRTLFVEVKAPRTGRLSKLQIIQIRRLEAAGADVRVVNSTAGVDALITELLSHPGQPPIRAAAVTTPAAAAS